jgi:anti-sigma B factor antagonist
VTFTQSVAELVVDVREDGPHTVLTLDGEIDLATAPRLRAYIDGVLALQRGDVIIDMAEVQFCDSTGLGVIMHAATRLAARGHTLIVRRPTRPVARILAITGVDRVVSVET